MRRVAKYEAGQAHPNNFVDEAGGAGQKEDEIQDSKRLHRRGIVQLSELEAV